MIQLALSQSAELRFEGSFPYKSRTPMPMVKIGHDAVAKKNSKGGHAAWNVVVAET